MGLNQVGSGCLTRASISERPSLTSNKGESTFETHLEIYLLNWSKMYAWDKERTTRLQQGIMLYNIWGKKLGTFSRKNAVLLDFVQMRGGGGPCPNFLSTFHKLYIRVDRHSRTCKKKIIIQPISVPSGVPRRGCSSFFCSNTLPSFATDTYK